MAEEKQQANIGVMRVSMRMLHDVFMLPEDYSVVTAHIDSATNELHLYVSSEAIPVAQEFQRLPEVTPTYRANYADGKRVVEVASLGILEYPAHTREELLAQV